MGAGFSVDVIFEENCYEHAPETVPLGTIGLTDA